jgi:hypothetical protein
MQTDELTQYDKANTIGKLANMLKQASNAASHELKTGRTDDGGSSNFDTAAFMLKHTTRKDVELAARLAGVQVDNFTWFGSKMWFWLRTETAGQGDRRTRIAKAAQDVIDSHKDKIPGLQSCFYQQAD